MLDRRLLFALSIAASALAPGCLLDSGPYASESTGGAGGNPTGPGGSTTSQGGSGAGGSTTSQGGSGAGGSGGSTTTTTTTGMTGTPCDTPTDCFDDRPCTKDLCQDGFCANPFEAENFAPPGVDTNLNDCAAEVCDAQGTLKKVPMDTQAPVNDDDPCTVQYCAGTAAVVTEVLNDQTPCGVGACDVSACQAGTCVHKNADNGTSCGQMTSCSSNLCQEGLCVFDTKPNGTVIDSGVGGTCLDSVCQNGSPVNVPNFENCNDPNPNNCTVPSCSAAGACGNGVPAPDNFPCSAGGSPGHCVNGACVAN